MGFLLIALVSIFAAHTNHSGRSLSSRRSSQFAIVRRPLVAAVKKSLRDCRHPPTLC
jgi:hypothetical protein